MNETGGKRQYQIETVEENPGQFSWRIVNRDVDTHQQVGAPVVSVTLYTTEEAAQAAASETLRKLVAGSFTIPSPRATG